MGDHLAATLRLVAAVMADATKPWWVIGSAAVAWHGIATSVADVDVLLDGEDVPRVFSALGLPIEAGLPDARFRSDVFARWQASPLPVEWMAGLCLRDGERWVPVALATRLVIDGVPVPARGELADLLRRFGRAKDLKRAEQLALTF